MSIRAIGREFAGSPRGVRFSLVGVWFVVNFTLRQADKQYGRGIIALETVIKRLSSIVRYACCCRSLLLISLKLVSIARLMPYYVGHPGSRLS